VTQEKKHSDLQNLHRLLLQMKKYWTRLCGIFLLDLLATPLALLGPLPLMLAVDNVIGSKPLPHFLSTVIPVSIADSKEFMLLIVAVLIILITLLSQLQSLGAYLFKSYIGAKIVLDIRRRLLYHAQMLSLTYHDTKGTADSIYRIQYDVMSVQNVIIYGIPSFITLSLTFAGMVFVIVQINNQIALIALSISPILILTSYFSRKKLRKGYKKVKKLESSNLSIIHEILSSIRVVKVFGQEERENNRFLMHSTLSLKKRIKLLLSESAFSLINSMSIALGTTLVLFYGVKNVQAQMLTIGQLLLVMSYLAHLYSPLKSLVKELMKVQDGFTGLERIFNLFDKKYDVIERPNALTVKQVNGNIRFQDVSFSYDGKNNVLTNLSFDTPSGSRVGIVGRTGSGKTTLTSLLMRLYDPTSGTIFLDAVDLKDLKVQQLRDQFAVVLQEPILLTGSIADNIAYAYPDATIDEIKTAATAANAHEFISGFPEGYDTLVGERGMRLSGGERQRIALARAFLKNAPILILDEPTSAVDVQTEAIIMDATNRLMKNRTTFMIAHRLSTLKSCDILLRIDNGRLIFQTTDVMTEIYS